MATALLPAPARPSRTSRWPMRRHALLPAAATFALGLWGLQRGGSVWRDEAVTYDMAQRSLPELLATLGQADAVHGLYYLLMHAVFSCFGDSVLALRLPSLLAMSAAATGVALLAGRLAGPRAGLLAGLVFALLPMVQLYAQEGRSYAMVCAAVTWATWLLVRALEKHTRRLWISYGAVVLVACLLHEFAVFALAAHAVTLLTGKHCRAGKRAWACAAGSAAAGLAPLILISSRQSQQVSWIGPPGAGELIGFLVPSLIGMACAATIPKARRRLLACALPLLIGPGGVLLLLSAIVPLYVDRYVLYKEIGLALLLGAALDHLWRVPRRRPLVIALVATAVAVALIPVGRYLRSPDSRQDDLSAIARAVEAQARPGDGLLFMPSRRRVWQAVDPGAFDGLVDLAVQTGPRASGTLYGVELPASRIRARMLAADRIVALRDPAGEPVDDTAEEAVKRAVLRTHFRVCGSTQVQGARITVFARSGHC